MKELTIDGIKPPPHSVAFGSYTTSNIAAQVRPVVNLPGKSAHSINSPHKQTHVFMVTIYQFTLARMVPQAPRPTTIARHAAPVRLRLAQPNVEPNGGELTLSTV